MPYAHLVKPGERVKLKDHNPDENGSLNKEEGLRRTDELGKEVEELQELLFATKQTALLCVFQAMDTGGKDGAINRVIRYVNVQSCRVSYFKVPTPEEIAHDFLWRIHAQTPPLGGITLFNRSHYEDVLVVRVHGLVPDKVWKARYDKINAFEELLTSANTIVLKFFLHISKEEQEQRLLARERDPSKAWKLAAQDWKERELWDDYQRAYEDALTRCSTDWAPWRIVPSNRKWFRDLTIAEAMAETLRPRRKEWEKHLEEIGRNGRAEIEEYRKSG